MERADTRNRKIPFRTCFRLEPPVSEVDDGWNLRYFLQASDDPSLLVPADEVWKESQDTLSFLTRKFDHPQEKLLADFEKASRLFTVWGQGVEKASRLQDEDESYPLEL